MNKQEQLAALETALNATGIGEVQHYPTRQWVTDILENVLESLREELAAQEVDEELPLTITIDYKKGVEWTGYFSNDSTREEIQEWVGECLTTVIDYLRPQNPVPSATAEQVRKMRENGERGVYDFETGQFTPQNPAPQEPSQNWLNSGSFHKVDLSPLRAGETEHNANKDLEGPGNV